MLCSPWGGTEGGGEALGWLWCWERGQPTRAGMGTGTGESPAPRGCPAVLLGSGSQRVSGYLSPLGASPPGCQGRYLSPRGAIFSSVVTTSPGHWLAIRSSSDSMLRWPDSMVTYSQFS